MSTCLGNYWQLTTSRLQSSPVQSFHVVYIAHTSLTQRDASRVRDCLITTRDMTRPDGESKPADIISISFTFTPHDALHTFGLAKMMLLDQFRATSAFVDAKAVLTCSLGGSARPVRVLASKATRCYFHSQRPMPSALESPDICNCSPCLSPCSVHLCPSLLLSLTFCLPSRDGVHRKLSHLLGPLD
jgi:hypothetical protein